MSPSCHWPSSRSLPGAASPSTRSPSPEHDLQAALASTARSVGVDSNKFVEFGEPGTPLGMLMQAHSWNLCSRELTIEGRLSLEAALVCPLSLLNPLCALLVCICADGGEPAGTRVHPFCEIQMTDEVTNHRRARDSGAGQHLCRVLRDLAGQDRGGEATARGAPCSAGGIGPRVPRRDEGNYDFRATAAAPEHL